ncbi:hypothetical protein AAZX31_05G181500 [Glycine max]|uniref:DUF3727 domain-containing protein n=2 Tax=Glycine subgen. Soja TaxID=1462606 RepID=I1K520_SOYBN|nr:uncharacterized protein LOC100793945 [Glycine max]XP_028233330.1 uncharacterized protein LOC114413250 [Glycine soja]KAG5155460.1 hypothetical protein JHK82_013429 [Glycine max]KAH1135287.1 hypothetical protein GYH30_013181 [Glycine max]KHN17399.1 hypothetical protein glysoja_026942 [Glycine soja]KRH59613.1 hypothetical protein GLYMA_05G194700v4 [Glycine max]RZC13227.1 hypothetical protein D0Y65_012781 [Glycine soja]|eukprot:XP_003525135.1 uncharacterized protein LOC100793945 [Glycine max]
MAVVAVSHSSAPPTFNLNKSPKFPPSPISATFPIPNSATSTSRIFCRATNSRTDPVKNKNNKKKKRKKTSDESLPQMNPNDDFQVLNDFPLQNGPDTSDAPIHYPSMPLPEPPAGFVLDDNGNVLHASPNRLITVVDPTNNLPLECVIRRVFKSSERDECMLLCPVDTPVQILKSTKADGWSAISDEEVESILPAAAYALAKIHMHLVYSGYCYTARGGFCYTEEDIFDFHTDDGKGVDGLPTEGVEITSFDQEGARYMIYTPSDPLLFVAMKGENGMLYIADDDLLEDPAVIDAIDEETEFNALVEEEAALIEAMMHER